MRKYLQMRRVRNGALTIAMSAALLGCAASKPPERLYDVSTEFSAIRDETHPELDALKGLKKKEARHRRNEIILARKYSIDISYTKYETDLIKDVQTADFAAQAANIALGTTGQLVPVPQTKNLLNGIAMGVTSLDTAYSEKILREKVIESVMSSMRSARHERAAVLFANMRCSVKTYPMAMALSDLEAYYRAGTFTAGLVKLSRTVTQEESDTAAKAESEKGGGGAQAQAKLAATALEASLVAAAATNVAKQPEATVNGPGNTRIKVKGAHKCSPTDELE